MASGPPITYSMIKNLYQEGHECSSLLTIEKALIVMDTQIQLPFEKIDENSNSITL